MTLEGARETLLGLVADLDDAAFRTQFHPEFSPIGWHVGHAAFQEEVFFLRRLGGHAPRLPELDALFDSFASHKCERAGRLPERCRLLDYAREVRAETTRLLCERGDDAVAQAVARFIASHELQHAEIIATVRLLGELYLTTQRSNTRDSACPDDEWLTLPGGTFVLGSDDDPERWDNEGGAHSCALAEFRLMRFPVRERVWLEWMAAGGYAERGAWSTPGWNARVARGWEGPLYWQRDADGCVWKRTLAGREIVGGGCPVAHVSYYEAEAFARAWGARLPTEAEWEYAASWDPVRKQKRRYPWGDQALSGRADLAFTGFGPGPLGAHAEGRSAFGVENLCGGVWEWTASAFLPYPGFSVGTYAAYSAPWFGDAHHVARGGSFATAAENARSAFRNWYGLHQREPCLGLRLAQSL